LPTITENGASPSSARRNAPICRGRAPSRCTGWRLNTGIGPMCQERNENVSDLHSAGAQDKAIWRRMHAMSKRAPPKRTLRYARSTSGFRTGVRAALSGMVRNRQSATAIGNCRTSVGAAVDNGLSTPALVGIGFVYAGQPMGPARQQDEVRAFTVQGDIPVCIGPLHAHVPRHALAVEIARWTDRTSVRLAPGGRRRCLAAPGL
jgi:hypothetical protein